MDQDSSNAPAEPLDPPSVGRPLEERQAEEHSGSHQASEQTQTLQPGSPGDIEKAGPTLTSQVSADRISAHNVDNNAPVLGYGKPPSPQLPSKGPRAPISAIETLPELSKEQLATLRDILSLIEITSTSKVEFIWNSVLQLAGLIFVVVFGVFAALAYDAANIANKQSSQANQLALLNLCIGQNAPGDTCIAVSQNSFDSLNSLATEILGPNVILTTSTLSPSSAPTSTSSIASSSTTTTATSSNSTSPGPSTSTQTSTSPATSTTTAQPTPSSTSTSSANAPGSAGGSTHHLSTPAIVGTVVGVILSLASISISGCAFYVRFKKRKRFLADDLPDGGPLEGYESIWRGRDR